MVQSLEIIPRFPRYVGAGVKFQRFSPDGLNTSDCIGIFGDEKRKIISGRGLRRNNLLSIVVPVWLGLSLYSPESTSL